MRIFVVAHGCMESASVKKKFLVLFSFVLYDRFLALFIRNLRKYVTIKYIHYIISYSVIYIVFNKLSRVLVRYLSYFWKESMLEFRKAKLFYSQLIFGTKHTVHLNNSSTCTYHFAFTLLLHAAHIHKRLRGRVIHVI